MYSKIWHNPKWHNDPKMERNSQAGAKLSRQYSWTYKILDLEVADLITDCSENTSLEAILHDVLSFRFESHPIFRYTYWLLY